jgi:hypothetical protein
VTRDARLGVRTPGWGWLPTILAALLTTGAGTAHAQRPKKKAPPPPTKIEPKATAATPEDSSGGDKAGDTAKGPTLSGGGAATAPKKEKNFDFNALDLNGRMRTPQLLYFLERANEELERASLEKRSFIPHMVRSVEEEAL